MLARATAAFRSIVLRLTTGAAVVLLLFFAAPACAEPDEAPAWREIWTGVDATEHAWLTYGGMTIAPFSDMFSDGIRLRMASGIGRYRYSGDRNGSLQDFHAETAFADALIGYLKRMGPLTAKAFVGAAAIEHDVRPIDLENPVQGRAYGPKVVGEFWLNMGPDAWSSLDASWTSAHQTYSGRLRSGYRIVDDLTLGAEGRIDGNALDRDARGGMFVRYAWTGGEISLASGVSGRFFEDARDMTNPYATLNWLTQY
jgi:cellulose biosynthesis protein BcsS